MKSQVLEIIKGLKAGMSIADDARLVQDGVLSSLEIMVLIAALEKHFGIKIPVEEILPDNFDTIDAIVKMVERRKA